MSLKVFSNLSDSMIPWLSISLNFSWVLGLTSAIFEDSQSFKANCRANLLSRCKLIHKQIAEGCDIFHKKYVNLFITNQVKTENAEEDIICSWDLIRWPQKKMANFSKILFYQEFFFTKRKDSDLLKKQKKILRPLAVPNTNETVKD